MTRFGSKITEVDIMVYGSNGFCRWDFPNGRNEYDWKSFLQKSSFVVRLILNVPD